MTDSIIISGAPNAGSSSMHWHSLNWSMIENNVYRLQMRIAKAMSNKQYGKVKSLQWLLTKSLHGKLLAVKRVTTAKGNKTAGVDGRVWQTAAEKLGAALSLKVRGYQAKALRRIYIPKKNGKKRPLSIPTMQDRAMQTLYLLALQPIGETTGDLNSYGFRIKRSTHDAIQQSFILLAGRGRAEWVLDADIKSCFDEISHEWLLNNIIMDKRVLKQWLNAGYMENHNLFDMVKGTPQGGPISPTLANMVLDGLEDTVRQACAKTDKVNYS
jgi:RNA-directed DNA polymerase